MGLRTDPALALVGRRCAPARLNADGFTFAYPNIELALRDLIADRAWWVSDRRLDAKARIGRGLTERIFSLWESYRLTGRADFKLRARRVADEAQAKGLSVIRLGRGKPPAVGAQRPSQTAVVERLLASGPGDGFGRILYSYTPAVGHGTVYGMMLSLEARPRSSPLEPKVAALRVSAREVAGLLAALAVGYCRAVEEKLGLMGWETSEWDAAKARVLDEARRAPA